MIKEHASNGEVIPGKVAVVSTGAVKDQERGFDLICLAVFRNDKIMLHEFAQSQLAHPLRKVALNGNEVVVEWCNCRGRDYTDEYQCRTTITLAENFQDIRFATVE